MTKVQLPNGLAIAEINPHETRFLYDEIFVQEVYARYGVTIAADDVLFDVGANIGMFSLYMASKYEGVRLFCFEPAPHCLERLKVNLDHLGDNARIFPTALGETTGEAEFSYYPSYSILSGLCANEAEDIELLKAGARVEYEQRYRAAPDERVLGVMAASWIKGRETFRCPITTVSSIIASENISRIALLKIDVERAEAAVLAGITEQDWPRVDQLVVEVHDQGGREHEQMAAMLTRRGYETSIFVEPTLVNSNIYVVVAKR
jgi:FkbM family methyltransferase